jgi:hypothetical protein
MTRIDHTGHGHPSTTAARTECRKATAELELKARAFWAKLAESFGWGYKDADERARLVRGTAARLGVLTQEQAFGVWVRDESSPTFQSIDRSGCVTAIEALVAIYRAVPEFTWSLFCQMHS